MNKRQIGKSDLFISPLTLGSMSLGTNKKIATEIIHAAIASGINHIDTADLYDFGKNETIIGEAIKDKRHELIVTSKIGNHFDKTKETWFWDPSPAYLENALDNSLRRLQTDYLDLCLLHGGTNEDPIDDVIESFERLKEKGKIRSYGISSIRPNVIHEYAHKSNIDAIMMQYNILDNRPEELFSMIAENNISVLARGPLAKGILSNQSKQQMAKKAVDGYLTYDSSSLQDMMSALHETKQSITKLAFQYILHDTTIASAVFGASSLTQLQENSALLNDLSMDEKTYVWLKQQQKQLIYDAHRIKTDK